MTKSQVGLLKGIAKYAIGVLLLGYVYYQNQKDLEDLLSRKPHYEPLLIGFLLYCVILSAQYVRWYVLVRAMGLPFSLKQAFRLGMVGTFYNTFLPGAIGGDFVKAFIIAKGQKERKASAVATVIADRLLGLFGLLLFGAAVGGGFWLADDPKLTDNPGLQKIVTVCLILVVSGVVGFVGLGFLPERRKQRFTQRLQNLKRGGHTLSELWFTYLEYWKRPRTILTCVILSAIAHTAMMLSFHYCIHVFPPLDTSLIGTMPEHFVILPIGFIAQALVPVPGGLGAGEYTFGGLYTILRGDAGKSVGLAGRLTLRLIEWCLGLIGYLAYLGMKDELPPEGASLDGN